jgi:hypothetical protein
MVQWLYRVVLPAVFCLLGIGAILYGALMHSAPVIDKEVTKITVTVDATGKMVLLGMEHLLGAGPGSSSADSPPSAVDGALSMPDASNPPDMPAPPEAMVPGLGVPPGMAMMFMPPFHKETLSGEPVDVETVEREPKLVREVTIGGVTLSDGVLRRTYVGTPPSLCPT